VRIAQVAPLYERVPPRLYGGTERVVSYLTEELVRRGHAVTLFASGDSLTRARLRSVVPSALRLAEAPLEALPAHVIHLADVFQRAREFDVIHCHVDYLGFPFGALVSTPTVHTLHGRLDLPFLREVFPHFPGVPFVSISDAQRRPLGSLNVWWAATVYHGLPLGRFAFTPEPGRYLAFIGRISPEKRLDLAIAIAREVGIPLKIAAKIDGDDRAYYDACIRPLMDDPLVEYVGEIDDAHKPAFLGGARALLFPIDWPEPFGLAMIEALACGTPVIARPCGSVPEVMVDGVTGFVGERLADLVDAVKRVDTIDRAACRRHVERRFTVERMADDYEAVYRQLIEGRRAA
jgi:glycosyltransferase involved in cell wall biosynthesis